MIELSMLIEILIGFFVIGGGIVSFFVMQKGQNMKIEQLQKELDELKHKQELAEKDQHKTDKAIIEINATLKHIAEAIDDLKRNGHP